MRIYAVNRPGEQTAIMVLVDGSDALEEAKKGGPVNDVIEITEDEAALIRAARPVPVVPDAVVPVGYVSKEEFDELKRQFAAMAADIKAAVVVGG